MPALVTAALATIGGRSSYRAAVAAATAQVRGAAGNLATDAGHAQHELRDAVTDLLRWARRAPGVTRAETTLAGPTGVVTAPARHRAEVDHGPSLAVKRGHGRT